jgi:hypothetical protein
MLPDPLHLHKEQKQYSKGSGVGPTFERGESRIHPWSETDSEQDSQLLLLVRLEEKLWTAFPGFCQVNIALCVGSEARQRSGTEKDLLIKSIGLTRSH